MTRKKILEEEKQRMHGKGFYYPLSVDYDLIWKEYEMLCERECDGRKQESYKSHIDRRLGFITRRIIFKFVFENTKSDVIKESITKIVKEENEKNKKIYNKYYERNQRKES